MAPRILVADDSVTIQKVVELTFSKEDFILVQARSGEEAIRKAREVRPDLVLLDLVMPDKSGYEVCAALRAEPALSTVPIILLTGTFESLDRERAVKAGANDFVTKPFESQVLISKVKQLLFVRTVDLGPPPVPAGAGRAAAPEEMRRPAPSLVPPPRETPLPQPLAAAFQGQAAAIAPASPALNAAPPKAPLVDPVPIPQGKTVSGVVAPARPAPPSAPAMGPALGGATAAPPAASPLVPEPVFELFPPTEEISQDRLWQALDSAPSADSAVKPAGLAELRLEDLIDLPAPVAVELPLVEFPLEAEPITPASMTTGIEERSPAIEIREVEVGRPAEDLSLEKFLSPGLAAPRAGAELEPPTQEAFPGESVFDLTEEMEAPALPLVEVGTGEPPTLSVDDLLRPTEAEQFSTIAPSGVEFRELELEPPSQEALPGESVFDLTEEMEAPALPLVEVGTGEPPTLSVDDLLRPTEAEGFPPRATFPGGPPELTLEPPPTSVAEEAPPSQRFAGPPAELDLEALVDSPPVGRRTIAAGGELARAGMPVEAAVAPPMAPSAQAPASTGVAEALTPEMAAMRQAVTERVARDLAEVLRDTLVDRIERVVWEVVPDLAEILITKEIERIRALAKGKQSS